MDTNKYKSRSIYIEHINKAKTMGYTINEYMTFLQSLADQEKSIEQREQYLRLKTLEGTVASLVDALKHQRYLTDSQSKKIDGQSEIISQQIEITTKLINAFGSNVEFIEALKKEITA